MKEKIAIINYKVGNVKSVFNMLKYVGADVFLASEKEEIQKAGKYILPGVGAFDTAMEKICNLGLKELLEKEILIKGKMALGICLGMQLFAKSSEEGSLEGLSWIDKKVVKFNHDGSLTGKFKIPHMGWNEVCEIKPHKIFSNIKRPMRFYFVHSYHYELEGRSCEYGLTTYGYDFVSIIIKDNIFGVQFHPEKSHIFGMQFIKNFIDL